MNSWSRELLPGYVLFKSRVSGMILLMVLRTLGKHLDQLLLVGIRLAGPAGLQTANLGEDLQG